MRRFFKIATIVTVSFLQSPTPTEAGWRACANHILELLSLPAEGRGDVASLVKFDLELAEQIRALSAAQNTDFEATARKLEFHLFPSQVGMLAQPSQQDEVIGFDWQYNYIQIWPVQPGSDIPRPQFVISSLPTPRYNSLSATKLIRLPNLIHQSPEVTNYLKENWDGLPGTVVMGHMLRHEWIHAKQHERTPWGLYMQARDLNRTHYQFHTEWVQRLIAGPAVRQLVLALGDRSLYAGAKLLNEFQAQSLMPSPNVDADKVRSEWLKILEALQTSNPDWSAIEFGLSGFQKHLGNSESRAKRYAFILSESALKSAVYWLRTTKEYPHSSRHKKVETKGEKIEAKSRTPSKPPKPPPRQVPESKSGFAE